jgi:hypothetical protein
LNQNMNSDIVSGLVKKIQNELIYSLVSRQYLLTDSCELDFSFSRVINSKMYAR